jgi:Na+-driven multidrug efflux pump
VGNKLDSMAFLPVQSLCSAVTAFVGQNMGAGKADRAARGTWCTVAISAVWTAISTVILLKWGDVCAAVFTPEQAVVDATVVYLDCVMPPYILFTTFYVLNASLRGAGDSLFPMINTIATMLVLRVPALYFLANTFGPEYMYWGYAVGWVAGCALSVGYYCSGRWKKKGSLAN